MNTLTLIDNTELPIKPQRSVQKHYNHHFEGLSVI